MDIRKEFLNFFAKNGHEIIQSAPLVPQDATLLFTNAGMVPFKSIFTGEIPRPTPPRRTSCQTCIRAGGKHNDLDNVGYTARHHTFFEMLGNFSFGDYFKRDAISYAWKFVTEILGFDKAVLYVSVHESDDEAFEIWSEFIDPSRIKKMGDKDNFWQMGDTGPCGPCSEIYVDQGDKYFNTSEDYFGGDGDRFLEIWNLVFMQYERGADGTLTPLPKPSIDTGMGLERVFALKEKELNNFDTSLFKPIMKEIQNLVNTKDVNYKHRERGFFKDINETLLKYPTTKYYTDKELFDSNFSESDHKKITNMQISFRVIADHARSVAFLLAQGVNFDKDGRGYVLRRILRRAVRHGYLLGLKEPFLCEVVGVVCDTMGEHYAYLKERKNAIMQQCKDEEKRFFETIESGIDLFNKELDSIKTKKINVFDGQIAFKLYDTYGFPLDLTQDMLKEHNIGVDIQEFESCMSEQKHRGKASWKGSGDKVKNGDFVELLKDFGENKFIGYDKMEDWCKIIALLDKNFKKVKILNQEQEGWILLDKTPFYPESGGPIGDIGALYSTNKPIKSSQSEKFADVLDTQKFFGLNISKVKPLQNISENEKIYAKIDIDRRIQIARHHSATHLLHYALREILGSHIAQAGSLVEFNKLRFDFTHPKALTDAEISAIETLVNEQISQANEAKTEILDLESAKKSGAIALFSEKYAAKVRVLTLGKSKELCGGTHVKNSAEIGAFFIVKESGVSAGVRRIEAVASRAAINYANSFISENKFLKNQLKTSDILGAFERQKREILELKNELKNSSKNALQSVDIKGVAVCVSEVKNGDIKAMIDDFKNAHDKAVALLFQAKDGKIALAAGVKNAPLKAGALVKAAAQMLGGNGGGRDDFATAGGKDLLKLNEAKNLVLSMIKENLG